jgi:hypothetical protein
MRLVESKNSFKSHFLILTLGGIGFIVASYFLTQNVLNVPIFQLWPLMISGFLGVIGALAIGSIYKLYTLHIYQDRLEIISIFGSIKKTIYLREITSWTEIYKENKKDKWQELTIYTDTTKYKITSSFYKNYSSIKNQLIKGKPRDSKKEHTYYRRLFLIYAIGMLLIGTAFLYGAFTNCFPDEHTIKSNELTAITGTVANELEIEKSRKGRRSVSIILKSYPDYKFYLSGSSYKASYATDFVTNVKIGDSLMIDIHKKEYQEIISGEGYLNDAYINIYGLRDKSETYLTLEDYNAEKEHQREMGFWLMLIIGLGSAIGGIYALLNMKR